MSQIKLPILPGMTGTRDWVYPQSIDGTFMRLRRAAFLVLHLILFGAPWLTMNGHPLLQIDLPARHVYLFGLVFTPVFYVLIRKLEVFLGKKEEASS